ncbi:hypothetical protein evm_004898 [Chilo suppressalis]|nr:hypothetical protein evm_004898 [Chilo suppressalis]
MVSDHRRPWTLATPGVSQMRCRPLRKEYTLFLKVLGSYWSGNTAGDNIFHSFVVRGYGYNNRQTLRRSSIVPANTTGTIQTNRREVKKLDHARAGEDRSSILRLQTERIHEMLLFGASW